MLPTRIGKSSNIAPTEETAIKHKIEVESGHKKNQDFVL